MLALEFFSRKAVREVKWGRRMEQVRTRSQWDRKFQGRGQGGAGTRWERQT